jgi:broad specificity phosphatase PhoE
MTTRLSFIRHGAVYNPQQLFYGRLPGFGLSETGRRQARAVAEYLRNQPVAALYTSELDRARETAAIIESAHPDLVAMPSPLLLEVHSPYEGTPQSAMRGRSWDLYSGVPPSYERPADVLARIRLFVARVRAEHAGKHIVAVSHGDPIAFFILWAHGRPVDPGSKPALGEIGIPGSYPAPASITTFSFHTDDENERPHMEHVVPYGT